MTARTTVLDVVTGLADANGLRVTSRERWCVCKCHDGQHRELAEAARHEGGRITHRVLWRDDRAEAVSDLAYIGGASSHLVSQDVRVIYGPLVAELAADQPADPGPYDPADEHDYMRDDPWSDR